MDSKKIGRFISERRKALGMTQKQLADRLGVTNKAVSKWETGDGYPDVTMIPAIAESLGATADLLLSGGEASSPFETKEQARFLLNRQTLKFQRLSILSAALSLLGVLLLCALFYEYQNLSSIFAGIAVMILGGALYLAALCEIRPARADYARLFPDEAPGAASHEKAFLILNLCLWALGLFFSLLFLGRISYFPYVQYALRRLLGLHFFFPALFLLLLSGGAAFFARRRLRRKKGK